VPDAVWHVVASLLVPSPTDRPATARAARALLDSARPAAEDASSIGVGNANLTAAVHRPSGRRRSTAWSRNGSMAPQAPYERKPAVARGVAAAAAIVLVVGGLGWVGGRSRLTWFDNGAPLGAVHSLTPMPPDSSEIVPTQYQWQLRRGVLTGRLSVSNPADATTTATAVPELFPISAVRGHALALIGHDGPVEQQQDGSVLVRFAVPPLAPHAHHIVVFRLSLPDGSSDRVLLARLLRDRQAAIARHALTLSDAPTIAEVALELAVSSLTVGQRAACKIRALTPAGDDAPADLVKDARIEVVGGSGVVRVDGRDVVALAPGAVVVRVVVGDLHAEVPVTVVAAERPKTTTPAKPRRPPTTVTTIIEEDAPPPAPRDEIVL
jgi:hypothetical protein